MNDSSKKIILGNVPILNNASDKFKEASKIKNVPYEISEDLCGYLSESVSSSITPVQLILLLEDVLDELFVGKNIPYRLADEASRIMIYLRYFPLVIDKIADIEFSDAFRKSFENVFEKPIDKIEENAKTYGVTTLDDNLVDISNKDKAEVLASLYNRSHPHRLGYKEFTPEPLSIKEAKELLNNQTVFDYLKGRVIKINLSNSVINTSLYNRVNGEGAAERAISLCRNIK